MVGEPDREVRQEQGEGALEMKMEQRRISLHEESCPASSGGLVYAR
jgi:hypothetical protein